jgi:hypothetical protein
MTVAECLRAMDDEALAILAMDYCKCEIDDFRGLMNHCLKHVIEHGFGYKNSPSLQFEWLKLRVLELGYMKCGEESDGFHGFKTVFNVGFIGIVETPEQLERLRRGDDTMYDAPQLQISAMEWGVPNAKTKPINRVARRVTRDRDTPKRPRKYKKKKPL